MPRRSHALAMPALSVLLTLPAFAGPLNPPAGPVSSSYKTLTEVEPRTPISGPFTIDRPGSYYLTQNISVTGNSDAITILVDNVTLDLNGFTISGGRTGVNVAGFFFSLNAVTIINGNISDASGSGIFAGAFEDGSYGLHIRNVRVTGVNDIGIDAGRGAVVENCYVRGGNIGIFTGFSSRVFDCTVESARTTGFFVAGGSTVTDCVAVGTNNGNGGGDGFVIGAGSSVRGLSSRSNTGYGASFELECTVTDSTFSNNGNAGVRLNALSTLSRCTITSNRNSGVLLDQAPSGISNIIERCSISLNIPCGIVSFGNGSHTIRDNTITRNVDFGIRVRDNCQILNNHIADNGDTNNDAGIFITGAGNLLQGNFLSHGFGAGIELFSSSSSNLVLGNTFRGATMRIAGSGHTIAPITNAATAVTGSNPFVNISY